MRRILLVVSSFFVCSCEVFFPTQTKSECSYAIDATGDAGHESVDLHRAYANQSGTSSVQLTLKIEMVGTWRPPTTAYSWFVEANMTSTDANGATGDVSVIVQRHDGVDETFITGDVNLADVTITDEANGVLITVNLPPTTPWDVDAAYAWLRTGYMDTMSSQIVYDTKGTLAEPFQFCLNDLRP